MLAEECEQFARMNGKSLFDATARSQMGERDPSVLGIPAKGRDAKSDEDGEHKIKSWASEFRPQFRIEAKHRDN